MLLQEGDDGWITYNGDTHSYSSYSTIEQASSTEEQILQQQLLHWKGGKVLGTVTLQISPLKDSVILNLNV